MKLKHYVVIGLALLLCGGAVLKQGDQRGLYLSNDSFRVWLNIDGDQAGLYVLRKDGKCSLQFFGQS